MRYKFVIDISLVEYFFIALVMIFLFSLFKFIALYGEKMAVFQIGSKMKSLNL
jgi:hypothetical protein